MDQQPWRSAVAHAPNAVIRPASTLLLVAFLANSAQRSVHVHAVAMYLSQLSISGVIRTKYDSILKWDRSRQSRSHGNRWDVANFAIP
jgi:hypothetical protein